MELAENTKRMQLEMQKREQLEKARANAAEQSAKRREENESFLEE